MGLAGGISGAFSDPEARWVVAHVVIPDTRRIRQNYKVGRHLLDVSHLPAPGPFHTSWYHFGCKPQKSGRTLLNEKRNMFGRLQAGVEGGGVAS